MNRLPYRVSSAPAIFQRIMDTMLHGLSGVTCYLDDILITGRTQEEHLMNLEAVLRTLMERGVRVKSDKCDFFKESLQYFGHIISRQGIQPTSEKVEALLDAPTPSNVPQL